MKIGDVVKEFNLSVDTLRYYEKIGLIDNVNKVSGVRVYNEDDMQRIKFILCMKSAGLSLEDIGKFIMYTKKDDENCELRLEILKKQKDILLLEIEEKKKTLDYLNYKINLYEGKGDH